jgi:DNA-binding MarR family transcriptional regulator
MNREDRIKVSQLASILELIKAFNKAAPLQHAVSFLHIALNPGLAVSELATATGTHLSTASRHVRALAGLDQGCYSPPLVASGFGRDDRTKAIHLTHDGQKVIASVLLLFNGSASAPGIEPKTLKGREPVQPHKATSHRTVWNPFSDI